MKESEFKLFSDTVRPGDIVYKRSRGAIFDLICGAQSIVDPRYHDFDHVAIIDKDRNIAESTFEWKIFKTGKKTQFFKIIISSGIMIRPLTAWKKDDLSRLMIQRLNILNTDFDHSYAAYSDSQETIKAITAEAYRLQAKNVKYPVIELVGTLADYILYEIAGAFSRKWQEKILTKKNIFNISKDRYCCAFVHHLFKKDNIELFQPGLEESVSYVGAAITGPEPSQLEYIIGNKL